MPRAKRAASCFLYYESPGHRSHLSSRRFTYTAKERIGTPGFLVNQDRDKMLLPMISTAREALGSTLLGRLLGPSSSSNEWRNGDKSTESLPPLKFKIGQEPNTPRTGSPGFQDGHWVRFCCGGYVLSGFVVVSRGYCCSSGCCPHFFTNKV